MLLPTERLEVMVLRSLALVVLLAACGGDAETPQQSPRTNPDDADRDGYPVPIDCDDTDPGIRPGVSDPWYDGIDQNCDGADDFDQDGDGYPVDVDCVDVDPDIHPGVEEIPYDGVDNDCDETTLDDDLDADGVFPPEDCDDEAADVYPGAPEGLGDGVDSDCDGGDDTTPFGFSDLLWEGPRSPRLVAGADHWMLGLTTTSFQDGYDDPDTKVGVGLFFELDAAGSDAEPVDSLYWIGGSADDDYEDLDLEADGDGFVVGAAYYGVTSLFGWALIQEIDLVPGVGYLLGAGYFRGEPAFDHEHADLMIDDGGVPWTVVCDDDTLSYVQGVGTFPNPGGGLTGAVDGSAGCFFEGTQTPPRATTCADAGDCLTWDLDPDAADPTPVLSATQPWAGERWLSVRRQGGVVTALPESGGVVVIDGPDRWEFLAGVQVLDAQAVFDGTGQLFLGVVADDGSGYVRDARLLYGDPASPTELPLPFEDPGRSLVPEEVAVGVTDDRVVLVVAGFEASGLGGQDGVGWISWTR